MPSPLQQQDYKILVLFGTRPELIKLAPVISALKNHEKFQTVVVSSSQHTDLLTPFLEIFDVSADYDLQVMSENQTPNAVASKVLCRLDEILEIEKPNLILVQGDTTTAMSGALAGFNRKISVGHIEAGLRSGNSLSPFPEEMNRRIISQIARFHFAATEKNRENILAENVANENIFVTGNTIVDALNFILASQQPSFVINELIEKTVGLKRILLTTHRRESFGAKMSENLKVLREFVEKHSDTCVIFPVHPNPNVRKITEEILKNCERIFLLKPLDYSDFVNLMKNAWLIVSDSGGVQEEAPSLGVPVLVLRENTERMEAVESGVAQLVGENTLEELLEKNYNDESWINSVKEIENPFGDGETANRIIEILEKKLNANNHKSQNANRK